METPTLTPKKLAQYKRAQEKSILLGRYIMFGGYDRTDLSRALKDILPLKLDTQRLGEVIVLEELIKEKSKSVLSTLSRSDLYFLLYALLLPEIRKIDDAPLNKLPKMVNEQWSHPELRNRLLWRIEHKV
jgi:hypothetical protein